MKFTAKDGKQFNNTIQLRRYEGWLDSKSAPGGPSHVAAMKEHGFPNKVTIERGPMGRHRITAVHPDGHQSTVVHGSNESAHSVLGEMLGVNPPIGVDIHRNASNHPIGKDAAKSLAHEDQREDEV